MRRVSNAAAAVEDTAPPPGAPAPTVLPVKVTGGDCQEMLKPELLAGVKLAQAEPPPPPPLLLLEGMETGGVACRQSSQSARRHPLRHIHHSARSPSHPTRNILHFTPVTH